MPLPPDEIARTWFERVWNQGSEQAIDQLMAPQAKFHGLAPPAAAPVIGPEGFKPFFRQFREAFPDIHIDIDKLVTEGDTVAVFCTVKGTHAGDTLGAAATHRPIHINGMGMARIENGRIAEAWNAFDFIGLYQQLGLKPPV